jgi:hypothetical protein
MSSFYGGEYFGGEFSPLGFSLSGPFFDGPFFSGGFFGEAEEQSEPIKARPGDEGRKRKSIYKPTGLPPFRKTVEERVEETRQIAREIHEPVAVVVQPVAQMSLNDIEAEIGELLRKKIRTEDEEIMLLLLLVAAA